MTIEKTRAITPNKSLNLTGAAFSVSRGAQSLQRPRQVVPVTLTDALSQLRAWCDLSRGERIEIARGITGSFQSRGTYSAASGPFAFRRWSSIHIPYSQGVASFWIE
jgi:hypothetical protein